MYPYQPLALLQSRTASTRLPGKSLLPVSGYPVSVLAAKRAGNAGIEVRVVTTSDESDAQLFQTLVNHGLSVFRGHPRNVLRRFVDALADEPDERLIFRLTADNVLPDGWLLSQMVDTFLSSKCDILRCSAAVRGVPVGVSAELTTAAQIRAALLHSRDDFDREHVTPWIYRNRKVSDFVPPGLMVGNNMRVTIDTFADYLCVSSLFNGVKDPIREPIVSLIHNSDKMPYRARYPVAIKPLTLGTAQFGSAYGITNEAGMVAEEDAIEIIRHAVTEGIYGLDAARAYGASEQTIGKALSGGWADRTRVITKIVPLGKSGSPLVRSEERSLLVKNSFLESCTRMRLESVDTLMLHRASDARLPGVLNAMNDLRAEGRVSYLGASVQSPRELEEILETPMIEVIQMPYNILDHRWEPHIAKILAEKSRRALKVHARSAFLQGLLCSVDLSIWKAAGMGSGGEIITWLRGWSAKLNLSGIPELCFRFVNSQEWVDSVVVGNDSTKSLFNNLKYASERPLAKTVLAEISLSRPLVPGESLDPSLWSNNVQPEQ